MRTLARCVVVCCLVALASGVFISTAVAVDAPEDGQFVVELEPNGDANAVFIDEFDLTDPDEREVFEGVRASDELRGLAAEQFREGMQFVSSETSADLDREIRVGDVFLETAVDGETGIVAYQFRWENLTRVEGETVVLTEPFSTHNIDRELIVLAPEGYELTSVSPQPHRQGEDVASWPGLTQFGENFEVVSSAPTDVPETDLEPISHSPTHSDTHGGGPIAFGVSILILASLLVGHKR